MAIQSTHHTGHGWLGATSLVLLSTGSFGIVAGLLAISTS